MVVDRTSKTQIVKDNISRILNLLKIDPSDYNLGDRGILVPINKDRDTLNKISSVISTVGLGITWDSRFEIMVNNGSLISAMSIDVVSIEPDRFSEVFTLDDEELSLLIKLKWGVS